MAPPPICKAHRTNGEPCKAYSMMGQTVCSAHGGRTAQARAGAQRRIAEERAAKEVLRLAQPIETDPAQALLDLVSSAAGEVAYWRARVDEIQDRDRKRLTSSMTKIEERATSSTRTVETIAAIEYRMFIAAQDRLANYASAALRAGVQERQVAVAEQHGQLLAQVIRGVLADLNLTKEQQERSGEIAARHLRLVSQAS